ncbi:hypothetical protein DFP72DRAFT_846892 [Ephemerocybe angulata]|uniref:Uncharacterized protein n=1 Tax=Ephemerocybe angulata TaxID=980116 RepID=A0A8H6M8L6_9AGAR|nr:hypothetical protein DFP72DRAFT_846892 [Tulosesus angulatus]
MPGIMELNRFLGTQEHPVPEEARYAMLRSLTLRDLKALASLRPLTRVIEQHLRQRIRDLFKSYYLPSRESMNLLEETGSIISGSAALNVIIPDIRCPRDLNLYCPKGATARIVDFLASNEYTLQMPPTVWNNTKIGNRNQLFNINNGVRSLWKFRHVTKPALVTLVESAAQSSVLPVMFFHNTLLMNYCDAREVRCLYPTLTFDLKGLHNRAEGFDRLHKSSLGLRWERLGISLSWTCETAHSHHNESLPTPAPPNHRPDTCQREPRFLTDDIGLGLTFNTQARTAIDLQLSWRLGFFKWAFNKVEYSNTQVTVYSRGETKRYSNVMNTRTSMDWRSHRERNETEDGRTDVAQSSFP